jgi:hypothetical protein
LFNLLWNPLYALIRITILLLLDIIWYLLQVIAYFLINGPVITLFGIVGLDIFLAKLNWIGLYVIWDYRQHLASMREEFTYEDGTMMVMDLIGFWIVCAFTPLTFAFSFLWMAYFPDYDFYDREAEEAARIAWEEE